MTTPSNSSLGREGEALARHFLENLGYRTLATNFRCPFGEIDLIAEDAGATVFVEVKTRRTERFGSPIQAVTKRKRQKIWLTALHWIEAQGFSEEPHCRFDILEIRLVPHSAAQIDHHIGIEIAEDFS